MRINQPLAALLFFAVFTQSFSHERSCSNALDSDSGIHGPKYSEILDVMQSWQSQFPELVSIVDYGKSVKGKTLRLALIKKTLSPKQQQDIGKRPTLVMSGSTHGDEYLNIEDRLPRELLTLAVGSGPVHDFIDEGGVLIAIPILNPDGYDSRQRENANGQDLNRDWDVAPAGFSGFTETETKSLSQTLKSLAVLHQLSFEVTVDYHCCIGALLYPWSYTTSKINAGDLAKHVSIGGMATQALDVEHGITADILGYTPMGTTKDYYYATYGARAFTYEGRYGKEDKMLAGHVSWWEEMIRNVAARVQRFPFSLASQVRFL